MLVREAKFSDVPAIISVLKASLGEADLPLSEKIWRFKHEKNPFGKSLVYIAEEAGSIAGVRAFMRWRWQKGEKEFLTFRAVDTATHPDFQGQGIFKRLTLTAVSSGEVEGGDFVFNTPNDQSRPGYLKMGWVEIKKLMVGIQPTPFSFLNFSKSGVDDNIVINTSSSRIDEICQIWNDERAHEIKLFTPKTREFLRWRFEENPLQNYMVYATESYYLACYIKKRGNLKELRVSECIYVESKTVQKDIKRLIRKITTEYKTHFVSFSPMVPFPNSLSWKGNIGPVLTLRGLVMEKDELMESKNLTNWKYSLGDLELF